MKGFLKNLTYFTALVAGVFAAWTGLVVLGTILLYRASLPAPSGTDMLVAGDSQSEMSLDPTCFRGLFNCSSVGILPDQMLLRLSDLVAVNKGRVGRVLVEVSPIRMDYPRESVPLSELHGSHQVYLVLHLLHLRESLRPLGNPMRMVREVVWGRESVRVFKYWFGHAKSPSALVGGFKPVKECVFLDSHRSELARKSAEEAGLSVRRAFEDGAATNYFSCIRRTARLIRDAGMTPVFFTAPVHPCVWRTVDDESMLRFREEVRSCCEEFSTCCFDYFTMSLPESGFRDGNHLNASGARIFSSQLAKDLVITKNKED